MQFKDILYEVKGDYAYLTINRPKVLNAFTPITLRVEQLLILQRKTKKLE